MSVSPGLTDRESPFYVLTLLARSAGCDAECYVAANRVAVTLELEVRHNRSTLYVDEREDNRARIADWFRSFHWSPFWTPHRVTDPPPWTGAARRR